MIKRLLIMMLVPIAVIFVFIASFMDIILMPICYVVLNRFTLLKEPLAYNIITIMGNIIDKTNGYCKK